MSNMKDVAGGTIVSVSFESKNDSKLNNIESYWRSIRNGRLVPQRHEIDPRGLSDALTNAFVLERITGGLARFRIAGSHLTELAGHELRGMPLSAMFSAECRETLSDILTAVFDDPSIVHIDINSPSGLGHPALKGRLILLPLRSDLGDITRVLGGLIIDGVDGLTTRKLVIEHQTRHGLTGFSGEVPNPFRSDISGPRHLSKLTSESELISQSRSFAKHTTRPRSHLKLVVSN